MTKSTNTIKEKIIKGLELTHKKLLQSKKDCNQDFVISLEGHIVRVNGRDLITVRALYNEEKAEIIPAFYKPHGH